MRFLWPFFVFVSALAAQSFEYDPYFPKPSYFRKHFANTPTRVELQPPVRLADYVVDDKLELSLKNYLQLVMSNNPDISIQKLTVEFSRDAITRSLSVFDPQALARFSTARSKSPSSSLLVGANTLNQLTQPLNLQYTQVL